MKAQTCTRKEAAPIRVKAIEQDGKFLVVKVLPPGDASGENFPTPTANLDGANFRRYIREVQDEKAARRKWGLLA